ncbi:MAG: DNA recombination protein RmuC [bacterium]|nr:DNA recombination protein RmuC [bacterium]
MVYLLLILLIILSAVIIALLAIILRFKNNPSGTDIENKLLLMKGELTETVRSNKDELEKTKDMISSNTIESMKMIRELNETIMKLTIEQRTATEVSKDLKYFFDRPKLRGNYGEFILEEFVSQIIPSEMYKTQYKFKDNSVVDMAIFYRDIIIPVDSKFPTELFTKYTEEKNEQAKDDLYRKFADNIKQTAASISTKYIKPENSTSDFAVMFVPSDALYFECLNITGNPKRAELFESLMKSRVMLASPSTLFAFLSIVMMGMKQYKFYKHSKQIQEESEKLKKHVDNFIKQYESIGESIQKSKNAYETSLRHLDFIKSSADRITKVRGDGENAEEKEIS